MKKFLSLLLTFSLTLPAIAQEQIRQDNVVIGKPSTANDKTLTFDTADGASNPTLKVEKVSKKLKYDQNTFQLGGSSGTDNKDFIFNGDNKKLRYNGTANQLEHDGDKFSLGDGTNTDKFFYMNKGVNSPYWGYDSTTGKLVFSNDGLSEKAVGSGSGGGEGGVNILANNGFEDGVSSGWSNTGGTFTSQSYATPSESNTKFARLVASGSGQYFVSSLTATPSFLGAGCMADFRYYTATSSAWKFSILDASANVLTTGNLAANTVDTNFIRSQTLTFPCAAAGSTVQIKIESLAAATIDVDDVYVGGNKNLVSQSQAQLVAEIIIPSTAGCSLGVSSSSLTSFGTSASCGAKTLNYSAGGVTCSTADNDKLDITCSNLKKGTYLVSADFNVSGTASGIYYALALRDTTNGVTQGRASGQVPASGSNPTKVDAVFTYNTFQSSVNFEPYGSVSSNTVNILNNSSSLATHDTRYRIYYYPGDAETGVLSDISGWYIDANIGGGTINLGTSDVSTYTEMSNASLDLVLNDGSAAAKIGCNSTNPPTGLTCSSGSETVSVVFTPPKAGVYEACVSYTHSAQPLSGGDLQTAFQLIETSTTADSIIQEGKTRHKHRQLVTSSGSINDNATTTCGLFKFTSATEKEIALKYEQSVTGSISSSEIDATRNASFGQPDIHFTIKPWNENNARPVLVGNQVTAKGRTSGIGIVTARIAANGTVSEESADFINGNCTNAHPSVCTFTGGFFLTTPQCDVTTDDDLARMSAVFSETTSGFSFKLWDEAGAAATTGAKKKLKCYENL